MIIVIINLYLSCIKRNPMRKQDFSIIGKALYKQDIGLANALLEQEMARIIESREIKSCYSDLPETLKAFCQFHNIEEGYITGDIQRVREKVDLRRMFIALALKIYDPEMLTENKSGKARIGIRESLADLLQMNPNKVSDSFSFASFAYLHPRGTNKKFIDQVDAVYDIIKNQEDQAA